MQKKNCVGWSDKPTGLVFGSILSIITEGSEKTTTIREVLAYYFGSTGDYSTHSDEVKKYLLLSEVLPDYRL